MVNKKHKIADKYWTALLVVTELSKASRKMDRVLLDGLIGRETVADLYALEVLKPTQDCEGFCLTKFGKEVAKLVA